MDAKVTISGYVGGDVDFRVLTGPYGNVSFASFRLATTPRIKKAEGWENGVTTWLTVNCHRQLAQNVSASVSKGDPVLVEGLLRTHQWSGADGETHQRNVIEAKTVGHDLNLGTSRFTKWGGAGSPESGGGAAGFSTAGIGAERGVATEVSESGTRVREALSTDSGDRLSRSAPADDVGSGWSGAVARSASGEPKRQRSNSRISIGSGAQTFAASSAGVAGDVFDIPFGSA